MKMETFRKMEMFNSPSLYILETNAVPNSVGRT